MPIPARERGATALEFALVAPILLVVLFGAIEGGRLLLVMAAFHHAVHDAARCISIAPTDCATRDAVADIMTKSMRKFSVPLTMTPAMISVTPDACGMQINATLPYPALVLPGTIYPTLRARSCARLP